MWKKKSCYSKNFFFFENFQFFPFLFNFAFRKTFFLFESNLYSTPNNPVSLGINPLLFYHYQKMNNTNLFLLKNSKNKNFQSKKRKKFSTAFSVPDLTIRRSHNSIRLNSINFHFIFHCEFHSNLFNLEQFYSNK